MYKQTFHCTAFAVLDFWKIEVVDVPSLHRKKIAQSFLTTLQIPQKLCTQITWLF